MRISQKCYYALRALLELAKVTEPEPVSISTIGAAQHVPTQFLQVIMRELRQGGFVESRRGKDGGYLLARPPHQITMGEVIRFLEGEVSPVDLGDLDNPDVVAAHGAFLSVWNEVQGTVNGIYDGLTFDELLQRDMALNQGKAQDYVI